MNKKHIGHILFICSLIIISFVILKFSIDFTCHNIDKRISNDKKILSNSNIKLIEGEPFIYSSVEKYINSYYDFLAIVNTEKIDSDTVFYKVKSYGFSAFLIYQFLIYDENIKTYICYKYITRV